MSIGGTPFTIDNVKAVRNVLSFLHTFNKAIDVLCRPQHQQQHKSADAFLVEFSSTTQAWNIAVALLKTENHHYQYIGAQTLFLKVSKQWYMEYKLIFLRYYEQD
jgi:hypothetical protein